MSSQTRTPHLMNEENVTDKVIVFAYKPFRVANRFGSARGDGVIVPDNIKHC